MTKHRAVPRNITATDYAGRAAGSAAIVGLLLVAALSLSAQEKKETTGGGDSIGFIASRNPDSREVGLPLYPGARPHRDKSDDDPKLQLGLWGGSWGFKLVVLKLETHDSPEKVAAFYRSALGKYGKVWNCADPTRSAGKPQMTSSSYEPDCQDEHPEKGEMVLQAGTK